MVSQQVRQAFYKPRVISHPASVSKVFLPTKVQGLQSRMGEGEGESAVDVSQRDDSTLGSGSSNRGKEKECLTQEPPSPTTPVDIAQTAGNGNGAPSSARQTNVFSLVERFTFKPSSADSGDGIPSPPRLPPEF
jgi:hypothetical protein